MKKTVSSNNFNISCRSFTIRTDVLFRKVKEYPPNKQAKKSEKSNFNTFATFYSTQMLIRDFSRRLASLFPKPGKDRKSQETYTEYRQHPPHKR